MKKNSFHKKAMEESPCVPRVTHRRSSRRRKREAEKLFEWWNLPGWRRGYTHPSSVKSKERNMWYA